MSPVISKFHSSQTPAVGSAILVWTLRDAPAALLDEVFEHDAEMRDSFLQDWSGQDLWLRLHGISLGIAAHLD